MDVTTYRPRWGNQVTSGSICLGTKIYYIVRAMPQWARAYQVLSKHRTQAAAIKAMARALVKRPSERKIEVAMVGEYYDPTPIYEARRL